MRYPRKNSGVSLKAKNSSLQEGNWLFLQYLPNFSITELTAHWHRMQKLVFNSATSDHRRSRMEVSRATTKNLLSFSSWFISQEIESSSSPPPTALSKHWQRGVSSTGYSHLSRDEKAASVSSLLIMQPLRPEVKGCFVMAHGDQGGFCLTPQVLQPKIKMKLQDKWLHWNKLSSRPGKFLHCWDDLTLLICSFMSWEEEERALRTRLQMQNSDTKFVFLNTALRSQNYTLLCTWNTKALNPPHQSLLECFFFSVFLTVH